MSESSSGKKTQADRPIAIACPDPIGEDGLILLSMHGTEALGRLFSFELDLLAEETPVDPNDILGKNVSVRLDLLGGQTRYFNGYISRFAFVSFQEADADHKRRFFYRATMVPLLWFLTRVANCRIFQDESVPDIIKDIFTANGLSDVDDQLSGSYSPRTYCVQYRETDFNFISRLMENEGIYYYFKQEDGKHTLVLCDAPTAHQAAPDYSELRFDEPDLKAKKDDFIWNWNLACEVTPTKYSLTDYNPLQPQADLGASANVQHQHDPGDYEIFDYPGGYEDAGEGKRYAGVRLHELEAQYTVATATTSARGLFAGATFTLQDHPIYMGEEYLVTSIHYQLESDDVGTGSGRRGNNPIFRAQLKCIPLADNNEFRPQRLTPKPLVQGPQTAVVVGPSGEEIHTDKNGQVKLKFFWDRAPEKDETSSCWVRVSQPSAGLGYGGINIPRIGQEVIVEFLEGDPDRPIITGRVYNGVNVPPNPLPGGMNLSGMKSNSTKGGGGFNEMTMDDTKDKEQVFIHGQKDMHTRVGNDFFQTVVNDHHTIIQNNAFANVSANNNQTIGGNSYHDISGEKHENIGGLSSKKVGGSMSVNVSGGVIEEFGADHSETTSAQLSIQAAEIVIAAPKITLKTGSSSIVLDGGNITLEASAAIKSHSTANTELATDAEFKATAAAKATVDGGPEATVKAAKVTCSASGVGSFEAGGNLTLKGAMVQAN
jgi:type VI secretion system secreted protein VgrG